MYQQKQKGSIRKKLLFMMLVVTSLVSFIGYSAFMVWYLKDQQKQSLQLAKTVSKALAHNIAKLVLLDDVSQASDITSQLSSFPAVVSMILYKNNGVAIYRYKNKKISNSNDNIFEFKISAKYQDMKLGYIKFKIRKKSIYEIFKDDLNIIIFAYIIMIILSYILSILFSKEFTEPILKLVKFLDGIEYSVLKERVHIKENNEYSLLYDEINVMLDRIEKAREEQRLSSVAFETPSCMIVTDSKERILRANRAFSKITGFSLAEVLGKHLEILRPNNQNEDFIKEIKDSLNKYHYWSGEVFTKHKDGKTYPKFLTIQSVFDDDGKVIYYVLSFVDLSIEKEIKAKLEFLKQYDEVTGFAKRELFISRFQIFLNKNKQKNFWGALICFNIKDFKDINDTYGYKRGDMLLQKISERLKDKFPKCDMMAKIGTDEFVLWFSNIGNNKQEAQLQSQIFAEYLIKIMKKPFIISEKIIHISIYVGIELYGEYINDAPLLLRQADTALSLAKNKDNGFAFFDKEIESEVSMRLDMYSELIIALKEKQFELYYQLQFKDGGEIYGAEALLRWNHPTKGVVMPANFIPIAEKTGLIIEIGKRVLKEACKQLYLWQNDSKTSKWIMAVNVSAKQFNQDSFLSDFKEIVRKSGIKRSGLKIELTESLLVENMENVIEKMIALRNFGIKISLDDFGTGYSSLQYLKYMPLDQIKIDQTFVVNMMEDESDIYIIKTIIALGQTFGFDIIAEGVETKEHYEYLKKMGCRYFQGFYFAKPFPIEKIEKFIK